MTKRQLIDEIIHINQSAEPGFLSEFDDVELAEYLRHLLCIQGLDPACEDPPFILDDNGDEVVVAAAVADECHTPARPAVAEPVLF